MVQMIAGIDKQADIDIYLTAEEVSGLKTSIIQGVLIRTDKPKRQGTIAICMNDSRKMENGLGIGIDDKKYWGIAEDFHINCYIGEEFYRQLRANKRIGLRHQMLDGSKIDVYDRSGLQGTDIMRPESLEFYRDNRSRLPSHFG
jgi:hypothetical protein